MSEQLDDLEKFEAKETSRKLPVGWLLLFWGLIVWGAYYLWAFTPGLGGWSQSQDLEGGGAALGSNLAATIAFTAIPALAALFIVLAQRKRKA
jgi:N-terminal domain of cytochrome oxidase-cbb3, FixP